MHHGDARHAQAQALRQPLDAARRAFGVGGTEVADDAYAMRQAVGQHGLQQVLQQGFVARVGLLAPRELGQRQRALGQGLEDQADRKSTRLNSSHLVISYAVFCLKKKKERTMTIMIETQMYAACAVWYTYACAKHE